jgi:outer membrane protein assembly factor BamB
VNGIVYVGSEDGSFYAVDAETGSKKWSYETGTPVLSSAAVVDGTVFFSSGSHTYALDAETGALKWKAYAGKRNVYAAPAVAYGVVFSGGGSMKELYQENSWGGWTMNGFDVQTGKPVWKQAEGRGPQALGSPALDGGKMIWCDGYYANRLDLKTGKKDWIGSKTPWTSGQISTPAVSDGYVFHIGVYGADALGLPLNGELMVVDLETGKPHWTIHPYDQTDETKRTHPEDGKDHSIRTSVTVAQGLAFTTDGAGEVYALDYKAKKRKWKFEADEGIYSTPSYANGQLYFGCNDGYLYALDALSGKLKWKQKCGDAEMVSSPWIADGVIYIGGEDGTLYAIH